MAYNNVKLLSEHNRSRIIVDGVEIKNVTRLDIHRDIENCKTIVSINFECDLDTVEPYIDTKNKEAEKAS